MARRPRDRRALIARASAEEFSAHGYHGVTMETIASRAGLSAPTLHRHYPGKYALFRDAVLHLGGQLVDATAFAERDDVTAGVGPEEALHDVVAALIDTALVNRNSGGLYRWEARYLRADDQGTLDRQIRTVHRRIQRPLRRIRPDLTSRQHWTLSTSVLSDVVSVVDHRATLPAARMKSVLVDLAAVIVTADLTDEQESAVVALPTRRAAVSRYDALLDESMRQFNANGYHDTSVEDVAAAVGLPASEVYRDFSRKSDLMAAAFRRAAEWLSTEIDSVMAAAPSAGDAMTSVIDSYVAGSFQHPELDHVYHTERLNLPVTEQNMLRSLQRSTVESWAKLVVAVRPELTGAEARLVVHAAMALVVDVGRLTDYRNSPQTRAMVAGLLELALIGRYRLRITLTAR